jgi:hypothetical protein
MGHILLNLALNLRNCSFKGKIIIDFWLNKRGKGIETALDALPKITAQFPSVVFNHR